jgi:hypothetical protein
MLQQQHNLTALQQPDSPALPDSTDHHQIDRQVQKDGMNQ